MPGSRVCGLGVIGPEGLPLSASWSSSVTLHLVDFLPGGAEWSLGDALATSQLFMGNLQTAKKTKVFTSLFKAPTPLQVALHCQAGLVALGVAWPLAWRLAHRLL